MVGDFIGIRPTSRRRECAPAITRTSITHVYAPRIHRAAPSRRIAEMDV
jgi:hypothetical protein